MDIRSYIHRTMDGFFGMQMRPYQPECLQSNTALGYADLYTLDPFHRMALYGAIMAVIHEGTKVVLQFGRSVGLVRVRSLQ